MADFMLLYHQGAKIMENLAKVRFTHPLQPKCNSRKFFYVVSTLFFLFRLAYQPTALASEINAPATHLQIYLQAR
jgi:hypothetical protein